MIRLLALLIVSLAALAQGPLKIVVLRGEGARHGIKMRSATQSLVEVRDEADRPLLGAQVVFQLPASGPGGTFPGGRLMQRVVTDARGQAATAGFVPNDQEGRFNVKVTASSGAAEVSAVIAQVNVVRTEMDVKKSSKKLWVILALAGGGGAGAAIAATRGGGGSAGPPPPPPLVTLVPGPVSVGGPLCVSWGARGQNRGQTGLSTRRKLRALGQTRLSPVLRLAPVLRWCSCSLSLLRARRFGGRFRD